MDLMALLLSVEVARRETESALPDADIKPDESWWRRVVRRPRRVPGTGEAGRGASAEP